jgi:murein L,D-transpeptidase YcbB/YkuD
MADEIEQEVANTVQVVSEPIEVEIGEPITQLEHDPVQADLMSTINQIQAQDNPIDTSKAMLELQIQMEREKEAAEAAEPVKKTRKPREPKKSIKIQQVEVEDIKDHKIFSYLNEIDEYQTEFDVSKEDAVKLAQQLLGIRQTGELDQTTISALDAESSPRDFINDYRNRRKKK